MSITLTKKRPLKPPPTLPKFMGSNSKGFMNRNLSSQRTRRPKPRFNHLKPVNPKPTLQRPQGSPARSTMDPLQTPRLKISNQTQQGHPRQTRQVIQTPVDNSAQVTISRPLNTLGRSETRPKFSRHVIRRKPADPTTINCRAFRRNKDPESRRLPRNRTARRAASTL